jgi:hypothetical protein
MSEIPNNNPLQNIEIREHITREDVRQNKDKIFLFGDNLIERGFGGQAKEMRGEENSVGIPTKKAPNNNRESFFTDKEFAANIPINKWIAKNRPAGNYKSEGFLTPFCILLCCGKTL